MAQARQRIMPAGDSITWGYDPVTDAGIPSTNDVGWRLRFYSQLTPTYNVDMVGAEVAGAFAEPAHEGHPGYFILSLQNILLAKIPPFNPQIICLMIGTNDAFSTLAATMLTQLDTLLGLIVGMVPNAWLLVSPIPPIRDSLLPGVESNRENYNAGIPGLISTRVAAGQKLQLVHAGDLLAVTDLPDGVHPTTAGYTVMGDAWVNAVRPLLEITNEVLPSPGLPATGCAGVDISWDGSSSWTGPYDDVTPRVAGDPGFTVYEGRDGDRALAPPRIAAGAAELFNHDGRYSLERPDSPVYQRVTPGRPVRYRYSAGQRRPYRAHVGYRAHVAYRGIAVWQLGYHLLDDISQQTALGSQRVGISTIGLETFLQRSVVSVSLMQNVRTSDCVTAILDAAGWATTKRSIAIGDTTLLYWWCDERPPWDALLELVAAEGATASVYVSKDGVLHFENRNFRSTAARSTASQASFYDHVVPGRTLYRDHVLYRGHRTYRGNNDGLWFTDLAYSPGFKSIYNRATYTTNRRAAGTPGTVLWSYGQTIVPPGGNGVTLIARTADPVLSYIQPVAGTDYTVSGGTVSVTVARASGLMLYVTLTAITGSPTVSGLQIRGTPLSIVSQTTVVNSVDASVSIAKYSPLPGAAIPITLPVAGWPEIDQPNAQGVCDSWVSRYMELHPSVTFKIRNGSGALLEQTLRRIPSDRVTVVERNTGVSGDVIINGVQTTVSGAAGRAVTSTFACERADSITGAVWDRAVWDDPAALWGV